MVQSFSPGRLRERQWVRTINGQRVKTTYDYNDAGEISGATHSDGTLPVGHAYDRAGRLKTVTQDGTVTMNYREKRVRKRVKKTRKRVRKTGQTGVLID